MESKDEEQINNLFLKMFGEIPDDREINEIRNSIDEYDEDGNTKLTTAIHQNDLDKVKVSLLLGASVNLNDEHGMPPLFYAFPRDDDNTAGIDDEWEENLLNIIKLLLERGADITSINSHEGSNYTILSVLLNINHSYNRITEIVKLLLENGADTNINEKSEGGNTPLHTAVMGKVENYDVVKLLLERGANINDQNDEGDTPLHVHINRKNTNPGIVILLLEAGADPNIRDNINGSPLIQAFKNWDIKEEHIGNEEENRLFIIKLLLRKKLDDFYDLHKDHPDLPDHDIDLNLPDHYDLTPLIYAVEKNNPEIVKVLLEAGADPNLPIKGRVYPIALATRVTYQNEIIELLLEAGANPNIRADDDSLLNTMIRQENMEMVKLLLDSSDLDVNWRLTSNHKSPLTVALIQQNSDIISMLLQKNGIDVAGDKKSLGFALRYYPDHDILSLLLEKGADPNLPDQYGDLPLITVLNWIIQDDLTPMFKKEKALEVLELLLNYGADPNRPNENEGEGEEEGMGERNILTPLRYVDDSVYYSNISQTIANDIISLFQGKIEEEKRLKREEEERLKREKEEELPDKGSLNIFFDTLFSRDQYDQGGGINYKHKYLKYKQKYINLQKKLGLNNN